MVSIALFNPEIPGNTGNIIRLCACISAELHIVYPIGFSFDDKHLRRAGLDYHDLANIIHHQDAESFWHFMQGRRVIGLTTKAETSLWNFSFQKGDVLLFGPETKGLSPDAIEKTNATVRIPMNSVTRSLNLSNSAAVAGYEAIRQIMNVEG
ncbi:MAG: tRNA (cytidine(34)-2'-O)-methyltransferase [Gammaproteobacteria bacterium]|nr:tRNA (cytidine(34)-2'-O)-methyltransferase [Gammaproteobacteria bacterium]